MDQRNENLIAAIEKVKRKKKKKDERTAITVTMTVKERDQFRRAAEKFDTQLSCFAKTLIIASLKELQCWEDDDA